MKKLTITILRKLGFIVDVQNTLTTDYVDVSLQIGSRKFAVVYRKQLNLLSKEVKSARMPLKSIAKLYIFGV